MNCQLTNQKEQLSLLQFKAEIAACLCVQGKAEIRNRWCPSLSQVRFHIEVQKKNKKRNASLVPPQEIRRDENGQWPTFTEKRGRCKKANCVRNVYRMYGFTP